MSKLTSVRCIVVPAAKSSIGKCWVVQSCPIFAYNSGSCAFYGDMYSSLLIALAVAPELGNAEDLSS